MMAKIGAAEHTSLVNHMLYTVGHVRRSFTRPSAFQKLGDTPFESSAHGLSNGVCDKSGFGNLAKWLRDEVRSVGDVKRAAQPL